MIKRINSLCHCLNNVDRHSKTEKKGERGRGRMKMFFFTLFLYFFISLKMGQLEEEDKLEDHIPLDYVIMTVVM